MLVPGGGLSLLLQGVCVEQRQLNTINITNTKNKFNRTLIKKNIDLKRYIDYFENIFGNLYYFTCVLTLSKAALPLSKAAPPLFKAALPLIYA